MSVHERNTVIYRSVYEQPPATIDSSQIEKEKWEDNSIPFFSRDVPSSSKEKSNSETTSISYVWGEDSGPSEFDVLKVKSITFRKEEFSLRTLYKLNTRDGLDTFSFNYCGTEYVFRKTKEDVAKALLNASFKIKGAIESIVGHIATVLGNFYVISIVERGSWLFDTTIRKTNIIKRDSLDNKQKERLVELSLDSLLRLHKQKLILGKFSLNNILITAKGLVFTDLRKMRLSKRSSFFAEEFVSVMKCLFSNGLATKADVTHAAMVYAIDLENECEMWYREQNGRSPTDELELVSSLEKKVFEN